MVEKDNIFLKVGFTANPFNPMGVTKGVDDDVPPPVGVREQLKQTLKFLDEITSYNDNMLYAVIGPYGSGKSELMKYLYRYSIKNGINCLYKQFDQRSIHLYTTLKAFTRDQIIEPKIKRIIIFLDEIDDIPRMIQNGTITSREADRFFKDLRRFLERNDEFKDFRNVLLVMGLGKPSWNHMKKFAVDISDQRLLGKRPELDEPEDWQMVGLIRRYMYYYANTDLRKKMDLNNFYPISEGKSLALARLSALVHEHTHVNTRMVIKLIDRVIYYLANETVKSKEKLIRELTLEDLKVIIKNPELLNLAEEHFESALSNIYQSLENSAKSISEKINIDQENIFNLLFRIYFDHSIITDEEISNYIDSRYLKQIKKLFIDNNLINKTLVLNPYEDKKEYASLINKAGLIEDKSQIYLIKKYRRLLDKLLSESNFDPLKVPDVEYESFIAVDERNIEFIQETDFKELFIHENSTEILQLSNERWEKEIKDKQMGELEQKGIFEACRKLEALNQSDIMKNFALKTKKILNVENIKLYEFKQKISYDEILCTLESPKIVFFIVRDDPKRHFIETTKSFLNDLIKHTKEPFEGYVIFNISNVKEMEYNDSSSSELNKTVETYFETNYMPYVKVINIPNESVAHILFDELTKKERNHNNVIRDFVSFIRTVQKDIREFYKSNKRLPLDSIDFKVSDTKKLNKLIETIWGLIVKNEKVDKNSKNVQELMKYGEEFVFHSDQLLSPIEIDLINLISHTASNKITRDNLDKILRKRFALSCSIYNNNEMRLLDILTLKYILINERPGAKTNYHYHIFDSSDESTIVEELYDKLTKIEKDIENLPQLIDFAGISMSINIDTQKINTKFDGIKQDINKLEETKNRLVQLAPKSNIKSIKSENLKELTRLSKEFDKDYASILKDIVKINENITVIVDNKKSVLKEVKDLDITLMVKDNTESLNLKDIISEVQEVLSKKTKLTEVYARINGLKIKINDQLRRKGEIKKFIDDIRTEIKNTNNYLAPLSTIYNLNSKILYYTVENTETVSEISKYFEIYQPEPINTDLLLNEIPEDVDDATIVSDWVLKKLELINDKTQNICVLLRDELIIHLEPIVNILKWVNKRNEKTWKEWVNTDKVDDVLIELNSIIEDINSKDYVVKRQLEKTVDGSETTMKLLKNTFGKNHKIVFEIGKVGPEQAVIRDTLYDMFNKNNVEEILDLLAKMDLVKTSYIT